MFVADAAIVDPVLCTLFDVAVALDVVAIVDEPTTENTNVAPPDSVLDDVALAFSITTSRCSRARRCDYN